MLTDYYEYMVQKARQQEMIERVRQQHLSNIAARSGASTSPLSSLQRMACWLRRVALREASCVVYSQSPS